LVLFSVTTDDSVMNPAFSRFNAKRNLLYTCTESVAENGEVESGVRIRRHPSKQSYNKQCELP